MTALHDYRSEEAVPVTVSVAVVFAEAVDTHLRPEHLFEEAQHAVRRAKLGGRNRVEHVEISLQRGGSPPRDDPFA